MNPKTLAELAGALGGECCGDGALAISYCTQSVDGITADNTGVFFALKGTSRDGHDFVQDAFLNGAVAAVVSNREALSGRSGVVVPDTRSAYSFASAWAYDFPSEQMACIGITGTNGKSTVQWLLHSALKVLEKSCLRIGTLGAYAENRSGAFIDEETLTTPPAEGLHRLLAKAKNGGCSHAVMEVSSHALSQQRVHDVHFDAAIFTNLTRDHQDYHETVENYFAAKAELFQLLSRSQKPKRTAVVCLRDEYGQQLASDCVSMGVPILTYGWNLEAIVRIASFNQSFSGSTTELSFDGGTFAITTALIGRHNAENLSGAFAGLLALGFSPSESVRALTGVSAPPGRLEPVGNKEIGVYVDYAHTPDALENVLKTARELVVGKLWVIIGCGGDRDRGKRPLMGKAAVLNADRVIITSDNPRTEQPDAIIADILSEGITVHAVQPDRREAIRLALHEAGQGDVVVIAGKGHEDYQIIGSTKYPFSDQAEVRTFFAERA
jgi:UDP-N-acetylmuramoyl-L-alanyl-D-glutamate--2,6-diaminopimelate ligase